MRAALILAICLLTGIARAETIEFEVYELTSDGSRKLLARGTRDYSVSDIEVRHGLIGQFWQKQLPVTERFVVGASVHRENSLVGFGLWTRQRVQWFEVWKEEGFSWDWFTREEPLIYRKLQGPGRVRVTIKKGVDYEELTSVEFLEDVTLRLNASPWFLFSDSDTHHVVVRKGSVLKLAP